MNRMIAITINPGATTAAARLICPLPCRIPPTGRDKYEHERAEQFGEQPAVLERGIVEVLAIPELEHQQMMGPLRVVDYDVCWIPESA